MNAHAQHKTGLADPTEWERLNLCAALGMNDEQSNMLLDAWERNAPNASFQDFTRALVIGGAKLADTMECGR